MAMLDPETHDFSTGEPCGPSSSVGFPIGGVAFEARDEQGNALAVGQVGEIWMTGQGVMRGYWDNELATKDSLIDGWVRTGDLGYVDEGGYVYLNGRVKDVIIRAGQKVFPAEIERILLTHRDVKEACVVAASSVRWGEVPYAFVTVQGQADNVALELAQIVREQLVPYKRPVAFEVVEELPRNGGGKVLRRVLRERIAGRE